MEADENGRGYPEIFADLAAQIAVILIEQGIDVEKAADIGLAAAEHIRGHWSGQSIYLAKGDRYDISRRHFEIFEKCNGRNHEQLAREYNLTVVRIYQIVKAVRAEMVKRRQGALF